MIRLLQLLIFGHIHKWVTIREASLLDPDDRTEPMGRLYYQQCEHCGKVIRRKLS